MVVRIAIRLVIGLALSVSAMGQTAREYQIKAAFLYNLAKFVEWPADSFKDAKDPFAVCVIGHSLIADTLESAVQGKAVAGRSLVVRLVSDARQARNCQIVFISSSEQKRLRSILLEVKASGVLTVGETDTFIEEGGIVNFKLDDGRVRLQIHVAEATQRRLKISSKLLSLADIVKK